MCFGPLKRVCHWGPLIALGIVKIICLMSLHCLTMWWPPTDSLPGFLHSLVFTMWNGLVLYHFFSAMLFGPGYVPKGWRPDNPEDEKYLQYCAICQGYKAPRSHHCRKCERCVLKMDHHCPWINNCCGHKNHANFTLFLLFAVIGCIHGTVILSCSLYRAVYRNWHIMNRIGPYVHLNVNAFIVGLFAFGLAVGVIIAVGVLFVVQMISILRNRTGIENWIVAKANQRRKDAGIKEPYVYPYDLGKWRNFKFVLCRVDPLDDDDGIIWPVREDCDQYTLTVEQIKQKEDKKSRMRAYFIIEKASGSWFPLTKGFRVAFTPPCSNETRLKLEIGDKVMVSRWNKHWLYGEKTYDKALNKAPDEEARGWFPRRCAVELLNENADSHLKKVQKKKKAE